MGEPAQHVTIRSACPNCGRNAIWFGSHIDRGGATSWRIDCDCKLPGTQLAKR